MGWTNTHLHSFEVGNVIYGMASEDGLDEDEVDEATVTVLPVLQGVRHFRYVYDFGDDWRHDVAVESELRSRGTLKSAVCIDGENACPPEDCGGPHGYERLRRALANPQHEEHKDYLDWVGSAFDPGAFDLVAVNAELQRLR
jgi:Plasmid pRiA4b ORF-3-like protein